MAQLPVYNAQGGITTNTPGEIRNLDTYAQGAISVQKTADALYQLAEQWQQSKDQVENLEGKNKLLMGVQDILNEAQQFTDYDTPEDLQAKESELQTRLSNLAPTIVNGFSNNQNAAQFTANAQYITAVNNIKLQEIFRDKYSDKAKSNIVLSQEMNMSNYITTGDPQYIQNYKNDLESMFRAGFITEEYKTKMGLKTDEWEVYHVMRQAETDPDAAINNLQAGKYNVKPEYFHDLLKDLTNIKSNNQLMREYAENAKQNKGEDEATKYIYGNTSYEDKLKYINEQEFVGNISEKFAQQARRNIKQFKPNNERTLSSAQSIDEILRRAYDLNESDISDEEYLTGIRDIRNEINIMHGNGDISTKDAIKMNNQLSTITNKKLSEATNNIAAGYGTAKDYIDKTLPPELRAEAVREVFYSTADVNTDNMDKKQVNELYYKAAINAVGEISKTSRNTALAVKPNETRELTYLADSKTKDIEKKLKLKITITSRYRNQKGSHHGEGRAMDISMSEHNPRNREKILQAYINEPTVKAIGSSDPKLLDKFKEEVKRGKLVDERDYDRKHGTNHENHIHITVNSAGSQNTNKVAAKGWAF